MLRLLREGLRADLEEARREAARAGIEVAIGEEAGLSHQSEVPGRALHEMELHDREMRFLHMSQKVVESIKKKWSIITEVDGYKNAWACGDHAVPKKGAVALANHRLRPGARFGQRLVSTALLMYRADGPLMR